MLFWKQLHHGQLQKKYLGKKLEISISVAKMGKFQQIVVKLPDSTLRIRRIMKVFSLFKGKVRNVMIEFAGEKT